MTRLAEGAAAGRSCASTAARRRIPGRQRDTLTPAAGVTAVTRGRQHRAKAPAGAAYPAPRLRPVLARRCAGTSNFPPRRPLPAGGPS